MGGFDEFFADNYDDVVRSLALAIGDRSRADDAAQEAFAKAYRRWPAVAQMERPVGWVWVVATNQVKRWITRNNRRFQAGSVVGDVVDHADGVSMAGTIREALDASPPTEPPDFNHPWSPRISHDAGVFEPIGGFERYENPG
jgi:DNA-directed RNA polymerase specialized sigma24 family protein